jgi:hypothetical protein
LLRIRYPAAVAALLTIAATPVPAQFSFGGMPGGPGGNPMSDLMERVVFGTIEDANPLLGYLQVGVPGRGSRIVIAGEGTAITQMADVPPGELRIGDTVTVSGMPAVVVAEKVQVGAELSMADIMRALQGSGETPPAAEGSTPPAPPPAAPTPVPTTPAEGATPPAPMPPDPPPGSGPPANVTISGSVKSVEPLVVTLANGSDVAVQLPEGARVLRRTEGDLSAVTLGEALVAIGQVDEDGYLAADRIYLGESLSMGRSGFGRGRGGGPPMMPMGGPPGGGGGQ